jgi:hypothetical protein
MDEVNFVHVLNRGKCKTGAKDTVSLCFYGCIIFATTLPSPKHTQGQVRSVRINRVFYQSLKIVFVSETEHHSLPVGNRQVAFTAVSNESDFGGTVFVEPC